MTKSVASNGHANNHPRNCKDKPQTASVEGIALVESQRKAGIGVCPMWSLWLRMECLLEQSWDNQFHHLAGFLLCRQHHQHTLSRCLQTMLTSRTQEAAQLPARNKPVCFCDLVTIVGGQIQSRGKWNPMENGPLSALYVEFTENLSVTKT